jgi:lysophospholipase L1-like esterase
MRITGFALCGALALAAALLPAAPAAASEIPNGYVLGDSLGEGVADVSHLHKLAGISVHIRGPRALEQLAQTPPNATVFLVLGTNDANGTIAKLDRHIDNIVQAAEQKSITLIWLGPPCVRPYWDSRARDLDRMLQARFAGTSVNYVSMRDAELCSGAMQEPDGVHLKTKGYVHMWQKAAAAAGYQVAAAELPRPEKVAARIPLPAPRPPLTSDITGSIFNVR